MEKNHQQIRSGIIPKLTQNSGVVRYRISTSGEHANHALQELNLAKEQSALLEKSGRLS
jgi:hypothetical protein